MTDFHKLLELYFKYHSINVGDIISAKVVSILNDQVVLRAGLKSDSIASVKEYMAANGDMFIKEGSLVPVYVEDLGVLTGIVVLSHEKAKRTVSWRALVMAHKKEKSISGYILGKVKGGMTVIINGLRAFLPGSLMDSKPVKNPDDYVGKIMKFQVIKLDETRSNVVLSRRFILEKKHNEKRNHMMTALEEGSIVRGVVKNITDYGVFLDLGGLDGLLHITDISWRRIKHPSNIVSLGDSIMVKVLKFDKKRNRVSLGLKQLHNDPWDGVIGRYPLGKKTRGKITNITDYGAFVEIEPGIEGLVHVSEMDWKNKYITPHKFLKVGQHISVSIIDISKTRRRISLGMKHFVFNPLQIFIKAFRKNDRFLSIMENKTKFGITAGLPMQLTGLISLSRFWRGLTLRIFGSIGAVETTIISINAGNELIKLQPSDAARSGALRFKRKFKHSIGSIIDGSVIQRNLTVLRPAGSWKLQNALFILYNRKRVFRPSEILVVEKHQFTRLLKQHLTLF